MSTRCLVGTINADDPATARVRYVYADGHPTYILPTLDLIWSSTYSRDTAGLVEALLAHQWSYLGADITADTTVTFTGEQPVPGVGMASEFDADSTVDVLPLHHMFDHISWVYLIDAAQATVAVYDPADLTTPLNVHRLTDPPAPAEKAPAAAPPTEELLAAVRAAGEEAGRRIADTWAQDYLAGRASHEARATASRMLAGDPEAQRTVPRPDLASGPGDTPPAELTGLVEEQAWSQMGPANRTQLVDTWRATALATLANRVIKHCRMLLNRADTSGRDLSHLHPDQLRIGGVGVFAGDWTWISGPDDQMRIPVGFVGTLVDTWNGWAVFTCTRTVAEAIVADQQVQRDRHRAWLIDKGRGPEAADREVDDAMGAMRFDGDTIIVDETAVSGDADAVTRIEPDPDGRYVVMGGSWCWQAVDPHDCDRIVGDLPTSGAQQQFVLLPHTWLRVPHDRLRVTDLKPVPTKKPGTSIVTLALDGAAVAEARSSVGGSHMFKLSAAFGRTDWDGYVAGCRRHGRPASEAEILDALVTEYQVEQAVRQAETDGSVLTRLLDADGAILRLRPVWPAPSRHGARRQLGEWLRREDPHPRGHLWQLWTGTGWQYLASITGFHTVAAAAAQQPTKEQFLVFRTADALFEHLDRDQLIEWAADNGIPLDRQLSDDQIRALLRDAHREQGRQAGLPVADLPTLTAADGHEPGRIPTGGGNGTDQPTTDQPTVPDPDQPPTH